MALEEISYKLVRPLEQRTYKVSKIIAKSWAKGWHLYDTFMGKQRLKMLVLDLDGTALNDNKKIVPENVKAIQELKKKNPDVLICIATGRGFHQALRFAREIDAEVLITDNGGALYKQKDEGYELEKSFKMSEQESLAIFNKIKGYAAENPDMIWHFSTDSVEHNFITGNGEKIFQKAHDTFYPGEIFGDGVLQVKNFEQIKRLGLSNKIIKACVDFGKGDIGKKQCQEFDEYLRENKINFFQTSDSKLEIAPSGVNKGEALLEIINKEQERGNYINRKEVLALGDSGNDEPMFEKGFQSLCPSNAREDIKKLENVIELNETNNEPFIRAAIDNFQTKTTPKYQEWLDKELSTVDKWLAEAKKNFPKNTDKTKKIEPVRESLSLGEERTR